MNSRLFPYSVWIVVILLVLFLIGDNTYLMIALVMMISAFFSVYWRLEKWFLILLYATLPFSLDFEITSGTNLSLPSEGLSIFLCFVSVFKFWQFARQANWWRQQWIAYAVILFILTLVWGLIFSSMPLVSTKFFAVNLIYIVVGFFLTLFCLHTNSVSIQDLLLSSLAGLGISCFYVLFQSYEYGFSRNVAPMLIRPFFNDHTHFAAVLLLLLPLLEYLRKKSEKRIGVSYLIIAFLLLFCLFLTHSRAAWLGALVIALLFAAFRYPVLFKLYTMLFATGVLVAVVNFAILKEMFLKNRNDSNRDQSAISEQLKSVTNTSTDASNLERINRWKCALRMGLDRPLTGFGPGTYQFQYFPFQQKSDLTRISVHSPYYNKEGRGGSAHSEYLLSFSESGILGLFSWFFLFGALIFSFRKVYSALSAEQKYLLQMISLSLIGYFIHAAFNNFLNLVNFSLYFWMLLAIYAFLTSHKNQVHAHTKGEK